MLVSGITLEISTKHINEGATALVPKLDSTEENSTVIINISIPEKINGTFQLELVDKSYREEMANDTEHQKENRKWRYTKKEKEIKNLDIDNLEEIERTELGSSSIITIRQSLQRNKKFTTIFSFYEEKEEYILMAKDISNFRT